MTGFFRKGLLYSWLVTLAPLAFATTFVNRPLQTVVNQAENIVRGIAGESYTDWDKSGQKQIFTYTPLTITEVLKGDLKADSRILLRQPGGAKDNLEMSVAGTAHFRTDEDVVVLLGPLNADDGSYNVPGFATGKYLVVQDAATGQTLLKNALGGGSVYDPNRDQGTMSYTSTLPLDVFRKVVKGEAGSSADRNQFERSKEVVPDDDHGHRPQPPASPAPTKPQSSDLAPRTPQALPPEPAPKSSPWIPLSFASIGLVGGFVIWLITRKGGA